MKKECLYLILPFLFFSNSLHANEFNKGNNYHVDHYTTENGLPQNSVKGIVRDDDGFIWLATEMGIVRFDGQRFVTFDKSTLGLKQSRTVNIQLSLDTLNKFYIWCEPFDYLAIRKGKPQLVHYQEFLSQDRKLPITDVSKCYVSPGIPRMLRNMKVSNFIIPTGKYGSYYELTVDSVTEYRSWRKQQTLTYEVGNFWDYFYHDHHLFYFDEKGGFSYFDLQKANRKLKLVGDITGDRNFKEGVRNFQILLNDVGNQVMIALRSSIYLVSFNEKKGVMETKLLVKNFDCKEKNILAAYYDQNNGRLFLGSRDDGLFVIKLKKFITLTYDKSVKDNVYYSQTNLDSNSVFTDQGVILGININNGSFVNKLNKKWSRELKFEENRNAYIVDSYGYVWFKKDNILQVYQPNGKDLIREWVLKVKINKLLYSENGDVLWVATWRGGLYEIDIKEQVLRQLVKEDKSFNDIEFVQIDSKGKKLWVGTGTGLYWLDEERKNKHYIKEFKGIYIRSIYIPNENEVWIATYDDGFWLIRDNKVKRLPMDKNNYMSGVHCFVEDRNGFFWLPTNKGLYQVNRKDLLRYFDEKDKTFDPFYYYYSSESGFNTNEFNGGCQPCAVRTGNDYVSLPSMNGLVWFRPEEISRELPTGKIFIDSYQVNSTIFNFKSDTIVLPVDSTSLEVSISTPFFGNRHNLSIDYVLTGEDDKKEVKGHVDMSAENPGVRFSYLGSGTYKLIFKLTNGSVEHPFTIKELVVISPLHFYETVLFRVLLFLLIGLSMLSIVWLRTRQIRKRNDRLEQIVLQRTEELQNTLSVLRNSGDDLQNKINQQSSIIASISHDINTPLQYHAVLIDHGKVLLENKNLEGLKDVYENLASSTSQIASFTGNLLEYIKIQNNHVYNEELVSIYAIADKKIELFKPIAKLRNNSFINEVNAQIQVKSNPILLGILIHNLIDNAYKFTYNGAILLTSEIEEGRVTVVIRNSHGGMAPETIEWLTSPTKEAPRSSAGSTKGLGLLIVKEISSVLDIKLQATSTENITSIYLLFPDKHNSPVHIV